MSILARKFHTLHLTTYNCTLINICSKTICLIIAQESVTDAATTDWTLYFSSTTSYKIDVNYNAGVRGYMVSMSK